jgi:hypothetical protein
MKFMRTSNHDRFIIKDTIEEDICKQEQEQEVLEL